MLMKIPGEMSLENVYMVRLNDLLATYKCNVNSDFHAVFSYFQLDFQITTVNDMDTSVSTNTSAEGGK
jgi:hypothetical protein